MIGLSASGILTNLQVETSEIRITMISPESFLDS